MQLEWMLLGLGFSNLAMLGWLAAAAVPLLIHLWSRRRYREVPWAAVEFLLAAVRKHARRIQLQQWLLLALRTLLIVLVVLAVAKPFADRVGAAGSGVPTHRVLVIDSSFSMGCRDEDKTRLARAKELAESIVEGNGPADAISVVTLADPPQRLAGVEAVTPTQGQANLEATLDFVAAALQPDADSQRHFDRIEVYFVTDLQRSTWGPAVDDRIAQLAEQASLFVVDVGKHDTANLAVTDLRAATAFVTVGADVAFTATLHEFGPEPRTNCSVEFLVDDVPLGEQTVDIPAGGDATVRFSHRFRAPGSHTLAIRAVGDRLEIDNTRWLAIPVDEGVNVLCVGGERADARYIADALNPAGDDESPIRVRVATEGELAEIDLATFDCVFLSNVAQFTADEAERLERFVRQGGGLAIFLGDQVHTDSYNALAERGESFMVARLGEVAAETRFGLDPLEYQHPIVAPFRGRERAGLLTTAVNQFFRFERLDDRVGIDIALKMPNGAPLIVTSPLGLGRVVLVATAGSLASVDVAGEPWTTWPAWPSFLPIVREILNFAAGGSQNAWQTNVGSPLPIELDGEPVEITRPDGRTTSFASDTDTSGIYTVRRSGSDEKSAFAVNVDTRESDLAQADATRLPPQLVLRTSSNRDTIGTNSTTDTAGWQQSLLWTALGLLLIEMCLAWFIGRSVA